MPPLLVEREIAHDPAQHGAQAVDLGVDRWAVETTYCRLLQHIFGLIAGAEEPHRIAKQKLAFVDEMSEQASAGGRAGLCGQGEWKGRQI
ncbi:MAG: hypothetical protein AB7E21_14325 [Pseudodonghicola sp.]